MKPILKRIKKLSDSFNDAYTRLDIDSKITKLSDLEAELSESEIWNNPSYAANLNKEFSKLQKSIHPWITLKTQIQDIRELIELGDDSLIEEFTGQIEAMESQYSLLKKELRMNGKYDSHDAIVRISAGVGGTDAQDFAEMLERMYLRWSEKSDLETTIVDRSSGDEAGLKTSVVEVSGSYAYGRLKSENGVHRLVRLSPFNSDNLRQTSFALVEVLPYIEMEDEVDLDDKDIKIDVFRSGGHGGQSVNTTDSAVRITHIPTSIVVSIQNERSQIQNKDTAMKVLKSKLLSLKLEQQADTIADLRSGESANWGSQIRNYVLHPYTVVKDTRTKYEDKDASAVLDGKLDGFMEAYLESKIGE